MPSVPNTGTFSLLDVYNSVHGHAVSTNTNLNSCFSNAVFAYFDPSWNQISYAPANSQKRFRNYTPGGNNLISMNVTYIDHPSAGIYNYSGTITVVASQAFTGGFRFTLDFLTGSVPVGQTEARSILLTLNMPSPAPQFIFSIIGAGTSIETSGNFPIGTTNLSFTLQYVNDNWSSPRTASNFRLSLIAGTSTILSVPNSTVTNGTTYVTPVYCVESIVFSSVLTSGTIANLYSGQMNYVRLIAQTLPLSGIYDSSLFYKPPVFTEIFNTSGFSSSKKFSIVTLNSAASNSMDTGSYLEGTHQFSMTLASLYGGGIPIPFVYALFNQTGSTQNFSYSISPTKYCEFSAISYTQSIKPLVSSGHKLSVYEFTGTGYHLPKDLSIIPGNDSLAVAEKFSFSYKVHCPTGGYVNFYNVSYGTNRYVYDGEEYVEDSTNIGFKAVSISSDRSKTTLGLDGASRDGRVVLFSQDDVYIEIFPKTPNVTVNSIFPYKFGYYGIIT